MTSRELILERLLAVTERFDVQRGGDGDPIDPGAAICQDLMIFGVDVDDYAELLATEFGQVVWEIPWLRFTDQTASFRGFGVALFPAWFMYRLGQKLVVGGPIIPRSNPAQHTEQLTISHLARVIVEGRWIEPNGEPA